MITAQEAKQIQKSSYIWAASDKYLKSIEEQIKHDAYSGYMRTDWEFDSENEDLQIQMVHIQNVLEDNGFATRITYDEVKGKDVLSIEWN